MRPAQFLRAAVKPPLHLLRRFLLATLSVWFARAPKAEMPDRMPVYFVLEHAYGMGGTIRAVLTLAGNLAPSFDVQVISIVRRRQRPFFPLPPGVAVHSLYDQTTQRRGLLARSPSLLVHEEDGAFGSCSALTDVRLLRKLRSLPPGVLITTRPAFSLLAARLAPAQLVTVAQEHVSHRNLRPGVARAVRREYPRLAAVVVLTEDDRQFYATVCGSSDTRVERIPNALPAIQRPHTTRGNVVISAGRLLPQKRFDLLIAAYAALAPRYPDWQLHIYGSGPEHDRLTEQIRAEGLLDQVHLKGRSKDIGAKYAAASVFALAARNEGFGLVVIEAMSCGLPVVCCDSGGPAEIITNGHDGLLVRDGEAEGLVAALDELMSDSGRRQRLGRAAQEKAEKFDIRSIGANWTEFLESLRISGYPQ